MKMVPLILRNSCRFILLSWLMIASSFVASSQTLAPALRGEMQKLEFLVGEWKGKGWGYRLDGTRLRKRN